MPFSMLTLFNQQKFISCDKYGIMNGQQLHISCRQILDKSKSKCLQVTTNLF